MKRSRRVPPRERRAQQQFSIRERQWRAFLAQLPAPLHATAQRVRDARPPCLLCGKRARVLGAFVPHNPQRWGSPPGQACGCCYMLCAKCVTLSDREDRAEAVLWAQRDH
jgi:hypothetical protein